MFGWRKTNKMPARPDGAPLRDGDRVLYPGYPPARDLVDCDPPTGYPAWCEPTTPLPVLPLAPLARPYVRRAQ